jgi:hypothetical protein
MYFLTGFSATVIFHTPIGLPLPERCLFFPTEGGYDEETIQLLLMNSDERIANVFRSYREPLSNL